MEAVSDNGPAAPRPTRWRWPLGPVRTALVATAILSVLFLLLFQLIDFSLWILNLILFLLLFF